MDGGADTGIPETGIPETGTPDTGTPDTGIPETGTADTGASAGETGEIGAAVDCVPDAAVAGELLRRITLGLICHAR